MLPIHKILVATDFSEYAAAALGRALWLAGATGSAITVAHVVADVAAAVPGTSFEAHWRIPAAEFDKAEQRLRRAARERLEEWLAPQRGPTVPLRHQVQVGVPFVELIRLVQAEPYDLLLAGTRGLSGLGRMLLGSTAERLVRKCPCPVWVVKPQHEWPLRSVLVPLDFSAVSDKCLTVAAGLAKLAGSSVTALHAFDVPAEEPVLLATVAGWLGEHRDRARRRKAAARWLNTFVEQHADLPLPVQQQLAAGTPWQAIRRAADRLDSSLIVMGSVGRTGIPGFLIGNTAEKVLRTCDRSVLTLKPDGFMSPVQP